MNGYLRCADGYFRRAPEFDVLQETGEDRCAGRADRGGDDHPLRLQAAHLAWGEIGYDDYLAADEGFGGVVLGDAGEDLAAREVGAEIDFEAEEFVGFWDALGDDDLRDAEIDLGEVVDGDQGRGASCRLQVVSWGGGALGTRGCTAFRASGDGMEDAAAGSGVGVGFSISVIIWASPLSARGNIGARGPSFVPGLRPPHFRSFSLPSRAACSMLPRPSCCQTEAVA